MPRLLALALLSACTAAPASVIGASDPITPGGCTVQGMVTVEAAPDVADLVATVSAESAAPADATHRVRERQAALVAAFASAGIAPGDVAVSWLHLDPRLDEHGRVRSYQASIAITATTHDFDALADLMERSAAAGATAVTTRFRIEDLPALRSKARDAAAAMARAKAEQLAADLGARLGPVRAMSEEPDRGYSFLGNDNQRISLGDDGVHGESQSVAVAVSVTYDLVR